MEIGLKCETESRAHPAISHCSHFLLKIQSGYKYKSLAKGFCFDELLDFSILLLLFLLTLLLFRIYQ